MNSPAFLSALLLLLAVIAAVCLVLSVIYWQSVGRMVGDLWVKWLALAVKLLAGYGSVRGAYESAESKGDWWYVAVLGVTCLVLWEALEKLIDNRVKASDKINKEELLRVERICEARTELLTVFRQAVNDKVRRLLQAVSRRRDQPSAALVRSALNPEPHLDELLQGLAVYFAEQVPDEHGPTRNFRVGLYVGRDGVMTPLRAVNLNNPSYDVFSSYRAHQPAFRLDVAANASHCVTCVRRRETIIVEDCIVAAKARNFSFFNDNQRSYLRSMVTYYLDQVCGPDGTMTVAALIVDTDAPGFFRESERDSLDFCLREFGSRIKLELLLHALLIQRSQPQ